MKQTIWSKNFILVLLTTFFAAVTHMIFTSIFPIYVTDIGGNMSIAGMMITGLVFAGTITRLVCGPLQDKYGRRTMLIIGGVMFAINTIAYNFTSNMQLLFILRVCNGISQGVYFGAASTIVADIVPQEKLVDGIGYFGIAGAIGSACAPMIGLEIYQNFGVSTLFILTSIFALIGATFNFFIKPIKPITTTQKEVFKPRLNTVVEFAVIVPAILIALLMLGNSSITNYLATYGLQQGIQNISVYFMINSLTMIIVRLFTGKLSDRFGPIPLITIGILLMIPGYLLIALLPTLPFIILSSILLGIGFALSTPLLNALVFRLASEKRRGVANSTYGLFSDIGNGIGGSLWGDLSQKSFSLVYLLSALCTLIALLGHQIFLRVKFKKQ